VIRLDKQILKKQVQDRLEKCDKGHISIDCYKGIAKGYGKPSMFKIGLNKTMNVPLFSSPSLDGELFPYLGVDDAR